jgi:hypothetical protein
MFSMDKRSSLLFQAVWCTKKIFEALDLQMLLFLLLVSLPLPQLPFHHFLSVLENISRNGVVSQQLHPYPSAPLLSTKRIFADSLIAVSLEAGGMPSVLASRPCSCQHLLPFATLALESDFSVAPADGARRTPSEKEGERAKESRRERACVCV